MLSTLFIRLRRFTGHRAFIALLDQGAVSIASFGTGILLSRAFAGPRREQLGLYYLAVTIGVLIVEVQNALISTPHTVTAPTLAPEQRRRYNGSALIHHAVLSLGITVVIALMALAAPAAGMASHAPMLLATALAAGAIALRNFARFLNLALHRTAIACLGDYVVTIIQLAGILWLDRAGWLSAWSAVGVIGLASLAGGAVALLLSAREICPELARAWTDFRANWRLSRWVFASGVIGNAGVSLYPWLIDRLSGSLQTAVWGNCSTVSSASNPLMMGLQNWVAPQVSHAYARQGGAAFRRYVFRAASLFLLILPPTLGVLWLAAGPLLRHLYHDATPNAVPLVLLLASGSIVATMSFVISRGLYSCGRGELDVWANVVPVIVLFAVGWPLVRHWGAVGGAISLLAAQILGAVARVVLFGIVACGPSQEQERESAAAEVTAEAAA